MKKLKAQLEKQLGKYFRVEKKEVKSGYFSTSPPPPPPIEKITRQKSNNIYLAKLHTTLIWGGGEVEKL